MWVKYHVTKPPQNTMNHDMTYLTGQWPETSKSVSLASGFKHNFFFKFHIICFKECEILWYVEHCEPWPFCIFFTMYRNCWGIELFVTVWCLIFLILAYCSMIFDIHHRKSPGGFNVPWNWWNVLESFPSAWIDQFKPCLKHGYLSDLILTHCGPVIPCGDRCLESTLAHVMACCLTTPSHYLNQCVDL